MKKLIVCALLSAFTSSAFALDPTELDPILMAGTVAFGRNTSKATLYCQQMASYRPSYILSGTLVMQLWASRTNNPAGPQLNDFKMCEAQVGKLQGHDYFSNIKRSAAFRAPPAGTYFVIFALAEWNGYSYVPVDWYTFIKTQTFSNSQRYHWAGERIPGT